VPATFLGEPVKYDEALAQLLAPAKALAEELQRKPLGLTAPVALTRSYEGEGLLGLAIVDALRAHENADLALLNPGGLRSDLRAGELRYGDVFEVIPFDNAIATVTVNGDELARLLKAAYAARKGVFLVSGAKVQLSRCPGPDRLKGFSLESGEPPRADRKYRVVMSDFLARGGDGLGPALASLPPGAIDLGEARSDNYRDAIIEQWTAQKAPVVAPKSGRITFVDDGSKCGDAAKGDVRAR
jgi:5'-nucleotidase